MAITAATSNNASANTTSSTVTLPASVAAGDLLVVLLASDLLTAPAFTFPAGWTKLADVADTAHTGCIAYAIAAGGETSIAVTHTTERTNQIAWRIPAAEWHGTTVPEIGTIATGNSSVPNPTGVTPSWGSAATLWLAACAWDDSTLPTLTSYPTNYTDAQANSVAGSSAARVAGAWRTLTATSEDPGNFVLTGKETWQAWTVAVRPPVTGSNLSLTASDSITFSDSVSRALTLPRTASDSVTFSDSVARLGTFLRTAGDSLTFGDTVAASRQFVRSLADSITTSDSVARIGTLVRTASDSLTLGNTVARVLTGTRSLADSITTSDGVTRAAGIVRAASDAITTSDSVGRVVSALRSLSDSIGLSAIVAAIGAGGGTTGAATASVSLEHTAEATVGDSSAGATASLSDLSTATATVG